MTALGTKARRALDAALDAGRDPLADPELLAALEAQPEAYADVERLLDRLEALARMPTPAARSAAAEVRPFARIASLAAGAVLAIGLGLLAATMPERAPAGRGNSRARPTSPYAGQLLDFHVSIVSTSPTEQRFVFNDNGYVTYEHSNTGSGRNADAPGTPRVTIRHRTVAANRR